MAFSLADVTTLTSAQMCFFAEEDPITIIPSESLPELHLASGTVGPFKPPHPVEVPLWLACRLRKNGQCTIISPSWLTVDHLNQVMNAQGKAVVLDNQPTLPYHWMEIASKLLDVASNDIPDASQVRDKIEHLWAKKANSMRNSLVSVAGVHNLTYVDITKLNIGSMELNTVRPFFVETMAQLYHLNNLNPGSALQSSQSSSQYSQNTFVSASQGRLRTSTGEPLSKQPRSDTQN